MSEKIGILIPCRNVASTIAPLFESLSPELLSRISSILCIDNASKDNTVTLLQDIQSRNNTAYSGKVHIIKNSQDYNYGGSIKIGFKHFISAGFDWIIILHSDDQGVSNQILSNFLHTLDKSPDCDIILASRFKKESNTTGYSRSRVIGNLLFNGLTTLATGLHLSDSGTAITMTRVSLLKDLPYFELTNGLQFHPQLNILIYSRPGTRIEEIPLHWKDSELPSSVRVLKYCFQLFKMLVGYRINLRLGKHGAHLFPFRDLDFTPVFQYLPPVKSRQ